jgi:hypothetical protein
LVQVDMPIDTLARLTRLSDAELIAQVRALMGRERGATADVIAHLAELDTRDVHLREGYTSLYVYCRDALGLSEWEAYNRIEVARAARRFPVVLEMLGAGAIHLTAVRRLAPHLTAENHLEVLQSAQGRSKNEVDEIVARLAPRPDVPCTVRRVVSGSLELSAAGFPTNEENRSADSTLPVGPTADSTLPVGPPAESTLPFGPTSVSSMAPPTSLVGAQGTQPPIVRPLSPDRYKLQLTISGETLEMLRLARDMLGHAVPSGDDAAVVERALRALLAELARKKFADTPAPRPPDGKGRGETPVMRKATRTVPAAVKRIVWVRDLGRCAFVGSGGHRCNERRFVEFHHVDPYALGGEATVEGIQLRCRRHNDYERRLYFGSRRRGTELVPEQVGASTQESTAIHAEDLTKSRTDPIQEQVAASAQRSTATHVENGTRPRTEVVPEQAAASAQPSMATDAKDQTKSRTELVPEQVGATAQGSTATHVENGTRPRTEVVPEQVGLSTSRALGTGGESRSGEISMP